MIPKILLRFRRPLVVGLHLLLVPLAYRFAFGLRFDLSVPAEVDPVFWGTVWYLTAARLGSFALFGLYRGWFRHAGMRDLEDLVKAVTLSSLALLTILFLTQQASSLPRSILAIDWVVAVLVFGGMRFVVRSMRERRVWPRRPAGVRRAVIVGAGAAAERLLRECSRGEGDIWPVAIVDDDPDKRGMRLHGVPVVGAVSELESVVARSGARLLVIAIPSAGRDDMRRIVDACLATGHDFKIVPSLRELLDGRARLGELRSVQIEDLLGRDTIELELDGPRSDLQGRTVLVTGGAGSIGSELARQVARFAPGRLIVLDQAESPLYFVHLELEAAHPGLEVVPLVADITDQARMERVFARWRPDYVFHAAAYKHVPLMEENTVEAVRNNVLGTLTVAQCAAAAGAAKFVLISTDKAVHPSSVMGATKRVAEQLVLGWPALVQSGTDFRAVRFGNVLGSDGSVIPLFKRQMAAGQPLTVTHPEVTRYFMTIPEAVQLVLQAAALPEAAGRICMLEMGEPVKIVELAENLIRLSGLEPYRDVPIVFTGLRPGEKLHEELMSSTEATVPTQLPKIRIVRAAEPECGALTSGLDRLGAAVAMGSAEDVLVGMCALVPECVSPLRERGLQAAGAE
ncbi:MAG TPA: nucleoside-diphosphate sugar epimerase/dehydratase [Longimicrobium sp.]|nr:nucleoside-diphosphate sugar epimerase/dehydratase [Longimicrobium sp.]